MGGGHKWEAGTNKVCMNGRRARMGGVRFDWEVGMNRRQTQLGGRHEWEADRHKWKAGMNRRQA